MSTVASINSAASVNSAPAAHPAPAPVQTPSKPPAPSAAPVDTVSLSAAAQVVLTPAETLLEETDTNAQIVQAAAQGNSVAQGLLAAQATIS